MVQTLTPRAKKQRTLVLPGATSAEPWELWIPGDTAQCLQTASSPMDVRAGADTTLALPATQVIAIPLWLQETKSAEFRAMIALQLEAQGLRPRGNELIFDWSITAQKENRTLVLVGVLASSLPEDLETASFASFDLSARCWPLPANALVFWMEQDRLIMAMTRGNRLAYFHPLTEGAFTTRVLQEITCILASLQMQDMTERPTEAVIWINQLPVGTKQLGSLLELEVQHESRPKPQLPAEPWHLIPMRVGAATRERRTRRWQIRAVTLLLLLGMALVMALAVRFYLTAREVAQLKQWQVAHADELATVHETSASWRDLQPALDIRAYPLELLLHVSEAVPNQEVHLTLFDLEGDHLLIRAEAKNLTAAFTFFDRLKKSGSLAGYTWEMAQPHLLDNDITQLQVEGTHASAH